MKFQLSLLSALFFSHLAASHPILPFPFPDLTPAVNKPNENDLFLARWQSNFGHRPTKPAAPALVLPTNILPAKKTPPARLSAPADFDPQKLYDFKLDPVQPPVYPVVMHGALGFLKPLVASLRSDSDRSDRGSVFTPPPPTPPPSTPPPLTPPRVLEPVKQSWNMPPNIITAAELARGIVAQAQAAGGCPGCQAESGARDLGWRSRFAAWVKALWGKFYEMVHPPQVGPSYMKVSTEDEDEKWCVGNGC